MAPQITGEITMTCLTKKMMPEIPLGISLVQDDTGFILHRKQADGDISAMNLTEEEFWELRGAIGLLSRRIVSQRQAGSTGIKPIIAHPVAQVRVLPDAMRVTVLLTVAAPSGEQMTLELPPHVAKYIADEVPGILREMGTATKH
jgi:hypothetical protein